MCPSSADRFEFDLVTCFRYDPKLLTESWNTESNGLETPYLLFKFNYQRLLSATSSFVWDRAGKSLQDDVGERGLREQCDAAVMKSMIKDKDKGLGIRVLLSKNGALRIETHPTRPLSQHPLAAAYFTPHSPQSNLNHLSSCKLPPQPIFHVIVDSLPLIQSSPSSLPLCFISPASSNSSSSAFSPSLFTNCKTTYRPHYDAARARAGIRPRGQPLQKNEKEQFREVLLWNELGHVIEGSVRNVAFWRPRKRKKRSGDHDEWGWVCPPLQESKSNGLTGLPGTVQRYLLEHGIVEESDRPIRKEDIKVGEWVLLSNGWEGTALGVIVPGVDE